VGDQQIPFLPWTKAMYDYNKSNQVAYDPQGFCLPPGGPRMFGTPYPSQFIQDRKRIVVIFEGGAHVWREIHMDGRPLPKREDLNPTYFGYSVGHWEGDTLVVETTGFNEKTWLNFNGTMHTDELTTVERISRPNRDTLHYEATINDPGAYTKPWTVAWDIPWNEGAELAEYICQENNKFLLELRDETTARAVLFREDGYRPRRPEPNGITRIAARRRGVRSGRWTNSRRRWGEIGAASGAHIPQQDDNHHGPHHFCPAF
jgi:hypothetical protein